MMIGDRDPATIYIGTIDLGRPVKVYISYAEDRARCPHAGCGVVQAHPQRKDCPFGHRFPWL